MSNLEADVSVGMMNNPDFDIEGSISSSSMDNRKSIEANYASRCIEVSRFTGAPAQAAFYYEDLPTATTNEEVTADVQIGSVIGNGTGFVFGLLLHYLIRPYYRTGEHDFLWVAEKPDINTLSSLPMKLDTAYVRFGNQLFYVNKITNELSPALNISEANVELLSKEMKVSLNESRTLTAKELNQFTTTIADHTPYNGKPSTNPLYRNFKTLANLGWQFGATICNFLGIEDPIKKKMMSCILSDIFCFVFGLFAIPYWLIREKILKIPPNSKHRYALTGSEGWSKYARTALAFGISAGQAIGGLFAAAVMNASAAVASFTIAFWGGLVGVGSFILGLIVVPAINWITSKGYRVYMMSEAEKEIPADRASEKAIFLKRYADGKIKAFIMRGTREESTDLRFTAEQLAQLNAPANGIAEVKDPELTEVVCSQCTLGALISDAKNDYKNNYTRTGMTLGAGVFAGLGLLIGNWLFGMILSGIIFSAIGSVIGGVLFSFISAKLHRIMHPIPEGQWTEEEKRKAKRVEGKRANEKEFQVYLMADGEPFDFNKLPNGLRTIVLKKEGQKIKAYWVSKDRLLPRATLRLTIKEYEALSERFQNPMDSPRTIKRSDNKELVDIIYDQSEDLDNSWDYVARSSAGVFSFLGAAVVCLINPAAALLLVPIGTAIAGAIGWVCGILVMRAARAQLELEPKADTLPWTMRIMTGANIGSIIGGVLGIVIGFMGFIFAGPASIILAVSFFGAMGALLGGIVGALYDPKARGMIFSGIASLFMGSSNSDDDSPGDSLNHDLELDNTAGQGHSHSATPDSGRSSASTPSSELDSASNSRRGSTAQILALRRAAGTQDDFQLGLVSRSPSKAMLCAQDDLVINKGIRANTSALFSPIRSEFSSQKDLRLEPSLSRVELSRSRSYSQ